MLHIIIEMTLPKSILFESHSCSVVLEGGISDSVEEEGVFFGVAELFAQL